MISKRANQITPSATTSLTATVQDLKARGIPVIGLNVGEPDFDTPAHIVEACSRALAEGKTKYVKDTGIQPLREAISRKLKKDNQLDYSPDQIVVSTGRGRLCLSGSGLRLGAMNREELLVKGKLQRVEWE